MRGNRVQQKGGKGMAVLAFFIGILFGIILLLGAVGGGIYYVITADLDNVLGWFGVDNGADEDGDNKYINTDVDKGGVSSILELVTEIVDMAGNFQTLTLGEIDALVPATHGLVDQLLDSLSKYVEVDYDTLSATQFSELGGYIKDVVMEIRPYALLEAANLGGDGAANQLLDLLLCGTEAKYAEVDGSGIPLYYDAFTAENGSAYRRVDDGKTLARSLDEYVVEKKKKDSQSGEYSYTYQVYHYEIIGSNGEVESFVAQKTDDGFEATGIGYIANDNQSLYFEDYAKCSGNYFVDADGERIYIDPITIGSFVDGDGMGALEETPLSDLLGTMASDDEDNQKLISAILGDITVGDLVNGEADFYNAIQNLRIGDLLGEDSDPMIVDILGDMTISELMQGGFRDIQIGILVGDVPVDNAILTYLAYGITDVKSDENGAYTATYKWKEDGVLCEDTVYLTAEINDDDGKTYITGVYADRTVQNDDTRVTGTTIGGINDIMNGFMEDVTIADLLGSNADEKILGAIGHLTINDLSNGEGLDSIEIATLLDVPADNAILAYLGYGVFGVEEDETDGYIGYIKVEEGGETVEKRVYLATKENGSGEDIITGVYLEKENVDSRVSGTTLNGIAGRLDGFMADVKIKDLLDSRTADPNIIKAIGDFTISGLSSGDGFNAIEIALLLEIPADNAILAYLGYGITDVNTQNGTAKLDDAPVYLTTKTNDNGEVIITAVYSDSDCTEFVEGTKIGEINSRLGGLTGSLRIKDILGEDPDSKILQSIGDYTIDQLQEEDTLNQIEITALIDIPANNAILTYIGYKITDVEFNEQTLQGTAKLGEEDVELTLKRQTTDSGETTCYITKVTHINGTEVKGTGFGELGERIDGLMDEVSIKHLIDVSADNAIMKKIGDCTLSSVGNAIDDFEVAELIYINPTDDNIGILLYLAFGVTEVEYDQTLQLYTAQIDGETVYFKTRSGENEVYLDSIYSDAALTERVPAVKLTQVGDRLNGLQENIKIGDIVQLDGDSPIISLLSDCYLNEAGGLINNLTLPQVVKIPVDNKILAFLGYGITELDYTEGEESGTAKLGDDEITLAIKAVEENGTANYYIDSVWDENGKTVDGTKINDISGRIGELTSTLKIKDIIEIADDDKLMSKIGEYTVENVGDVVDALTIADVMDIDANSTLLSYIAYGITEINIQNRTAKLGGEEVTLVFNTVTDAQTNATAYYIQKVARADGREVEAISINDIGSRIDGITNDLTIGDLITIEEGDKLMNKLAGYKIGEVSGAIRDLELADVMDIDANSTLMSYLGYGLTNIDTQSGTATQHYAEGGTKAERPVRLTVDNNGIITEVYFMAGAEKVPVAGTKINEVSSRIDGLLSDLTVGELLGMGEDDSIILNAIKNSTINTLADDINNLSINGLYADSIYKDPVMKEAVESNASDTQVVYSPEYLYYEFIDGEYQLVNGTGKVDVFESGLYTYGEVGGFWKLLIMERLEDDSKTEHSYALNDMPEIAANLADNLQYCTLYELEDAEVLDFTDRDVNPLNSRMPDIEAIEHHGKKLGELTISQTVEAIASLMNYINRLPLLGV